jgi:hypothetical protein
MQGIVTVTVSQQVASAPSQLQRTGALISVGGTTNAVGSTYFLASVSDLATIKNVANTAALAELTAMVTTFFSQNQSVSAFAGGTASSSGGQGVYVFEAGLEGLGGVAAQVAEVAAFILNPTVPLNHGTVATPMYSWLCPYSWDQSSDLQALCVDYNGTTALSYFFISTTLPDGVGTGYEFYATSGQAQKSQFIFLPNPDAPSTEFTTAAPFYVSLAYNPSPVNLVSPFEWHYLYGVTNYALTNSQIAALPNYVSYCGTGASGGIANTLLVGGNMGDGNPFNYWYAIDWLVINVSLSLSAAVINGSNTPTNPLYYNQNGINVLEKTAQTTVNSGISFGMILSPATVTAVPFTEYVTQNPGDYATGTYSGLACTFTPARGFAAITIALTATNIPA